MQDGRRGKAMSAGEIERELRRLETPPPAKTRNLAIVLAAGHGKRIRSTTSKMLHEIWGMPTVTRVALSALEGLKNVHVVAVVGVEALQVARALSASVQASFAYQAQQLGTAHAVRMAMDRIRSLALPKLERIFILPGDMGLLTAATVSAMHSEFVKSRRDMLVLTGVYDGPVELNNYGRIVRAPGSDAAGDLLEILEHRDILAVPEDGVRTVRLGGATYRFGRRDLLEMREFNSGAYSFKAESLAKYLPRIRNNNAQKEYYFTDILSLYLRAGLSVGALKTGDPDASLGFNDKSALRSMEKIARARVYARVRNLVTIRDEESFFISDRVVRQMEDMDAEGPPLDIVIGEGSSLGADARIQRGLVLGRNSTVTGPVEFGRNVRIGEGVHLSAYPHQKLVIGDHTEIMDGDIIKGNTRIGSGVCIETGVNITGSDEWPTVIEDGVLIKGTSYLFGAHVEHGVPILHSVIMRKRVERVVRRDGSVQPVRYVLPLPEGLDCLKPREQAP